MKAYMCIENGNECLLLTTAVWLTLSSGGGHVSDTSEGLVVSFLLTMTTMVMERQTRTMDSSTSPRKVSTAKV